MSSGTSLIGQVEIPNTNLTKSLVSMVESDISAMELQLPDNEDSNNTGCVTCCRCQFSDQLLFFVQNSAAIVEL